MRSAWLAFAAWLFLAVPSDGGEAKKVACEGADYLVCRCEPGEVRGKVVFAITDFDDEESRVNLYGFAGLFLSLGCHDALFLDGDLSKMIVDPKGPIPPGNHFGAILAVTTKIAK